jgi:hypothetical protein
MLFVPVPEYSYILGERFQKTLGNRQNYHFIHQSINFRETLYQSGKAIFLPVCFKQEKNRSNSRKQNLSKITPALLNYKSMYETSKSCRQVIIRTNR